MTLDSIQEKSWILLAWFFDFCFCGGCGGGGGVVL
jgi:hypothetical protein